MKVRREGNRCCKRLIKWCPRNNKQNWKRHDRIWRGGIVEVAGKIADSSTIKIIMKEIRISLCPVVDSKWHDDAD